MILSFLTTAGYSKPRPVRVSQTLSINNQKKTGPLPFQCQQQSKVLFNLLITRLTKMSQSEQLEKKTKKMCDKPKGKRNTCRWGLKIQSIYLSLYNLLDFLHKKADITDRLKQHVRLKDPWHLLRNGNEVRKKKHVEMGQIQKQGLWGGNEEEGEDVEGRNTVWTFLFTQMKRTSFFWFMGYTRKRWPVCTKPLTGYQGHMKINTRQTFHQLFHLHVFFHVGRDDGEWGCF